MRDLPARLGTRPKTTASGPHSQLSQVSPPQIWGRLLGEIFSLPKVIEGHSSVSPASSRAVFLSDLAVARSAETSLAPPTQRLEPVHVHGVLDTSLHVCLPAVRCQEVCSLGWGEPHRYADHATEIMVYGPRDRDEITIVLEIVRESLAFARG